MRDYNDALKDGRIAGPNAEEVIDAIARCSVTKDRDLIKTVIPTALHPDGEVNVDGLARDLAFIKTLGLVKSDIAVADIVDMSFARAAGRARTLQGACGLRSANTGFYELSSPNIAAISAMM